MSKKFAFIGAPGAGKTTLATEVYAALKKAGLNAELVPEQVRFEIHRTGPISTIWEQYRILQNQREIEDNIPKAVDFVITDSSTLLAYFYAVLYMDQSEPRQRLVLQDMYRWMLDDLYLKRYENIFFLPFPKVNKGKVQDGTRFQSDDQIVMLDQHMDIVFTKLYKPGNIFRIDGAFETRLDQVMDIIAGK